jgi:hypothetical protein
MKKINCILFGLLFALPLVAQQVQVVEKSFPLPTNKLLDLNLKFGSDINIATWDKQEVAFKATILYEEEGIEKIHTIDIDDSPRTLSIETDYDFKSKNASFRDCNKYNRTSYRKNSFCIKVNYELILPKNAKVRLETISGNIEIKDFLGDIRAKSISGFVDVSLKENHQTKLRFKSVTGEIYTDFDVELDKSSTSFAKKLNAEINGGGNNLLALETISGNIFFRKL